MESHDRPRLERTWHAWHIKRERERFVSSCNCNLFHFMLTGNCLFKLYVSLFIVCCGILKYMKLKLKLSGVARPKMVRGQKSRIFKLEGHERRITSRKVLEIFQEFLRFLGILKDL